MSDAEAMTQAILRAAVEAAKAIVLVTNEENRRQIMIAKHSNASENTRHRAGSSLWKTSLQVGCKRQI